MDTIKHEYNEICRLCLENNAPQVSIFDFYGEEVEHTYNFVLQSVCNVVIEEEDPISTVICESCQTKLVVSYEFKQQVATVESQIASGAVQAVVPDADILIEEEYLETSDVEAMDATQIPKLEPGEVESEKLHISDGGGSYSEERYVCNYCHGEYKSRQSLKKHLRVHTSKKNYKCSECDMTFVHWSSRKDHLMLKHDKEWQFGCPYEGCNQQFYRKDKLRTHIKRFHTMEFNFHCTYKDCYAKFVENYELTKHIRTHKNQKHTCELCHSEFKEKTSLNNHMRFHEEVLENPAILQEIAANQMNVVVEEEEVEGQMTTQVLYVDENEMYQDNKLMCCNCGKQFKSLRNLNNHMKRYSSEAPYVCDCCGKQFKLRSAIREHMYVHLSDKKYKCELCDYQNKRKDRMEVHRNMHFNIKAMCEICFKTVSTGSLKSHMKTHTDQKLYKCEVCSRLLSTNASLKRHMMMHSGEYEPSNVCGVCHKGFSQKSHLKEHLSSIHKWSKEALEMLPSKRSY